MRVSGGPLGGRVVRWRARRRGERCAGRRCMQSRWVGGASAAWALVKGLTPKRAPSRLATVRASERSGEPVSGSRSSVAWPWPVAERLGAGAAVGSVRSVAAAGGRWRRAPVGRAGLRSGGVPRAGAGEGTRGAELERRGAAVGRTVGVQLSVQQPFACGAGRSRAAKFAAQLRRKLWASQWHRGVRVRAARQRKLWRQA